MFTGAMVALITPFQDGEIDFETLDELIEFQLENSIDGIVPVGTTGESPTLSHDEQKKVMERVVSAVGGHGHFGELFRERVQPEVLAHQPGRHPQGGHLLASPGAQQPGAPENSVAVGNIAHIGQQTGVAGHLGDGFIHAPGSFAGFLEAQKPRPDKAPVAGNGAAESFVIFHTEARVFGEENIEGDRQIIWLNLPGISSI